MTKLTVDPILLNQLGQYHTLVELCDPAGQSIGHFIPRGTSWTDIIAGDKCPYSTDQLAQMQHETGGGPLSEVWQRLGRK